VSRRLVVVGDCLLDRDLDGTVRRLAPDAPVPVVDDPVGRARPGGAGLAAALAALDGWETVLVTALAADAAGDELRGLLDDAGVQVVDLELRGTTPEKVRVRAQGHPLLRLDRGGAPGAVGPAGDAAADALEAAPAVLVSDYGRGVATEPGLRRLLATAARRRPLVWDPHPRGAPAVPGGMLLTPNRAELAALAPGDGRGGDGLAAVATAAARLRERWRAGAVAVTLGSRGALLVGAGTPPLAVPAPAASGGDPCGAGDRFAVTAAGMLAAGARTAEAVAAAVAAASAFVARGGAGTARLSAGEPLRLTGRGPLDGAAQVVARVRATGGVVVATGGCFDVLHRGHVSILEGARALGDCLVVCLNSDASVRRLKGPTRPLVGEDDRAALLASLRCVDAVVRFDEDRPDAVLERLRPDIWAKGGDYSLAELPEAALLAGWGGTAVVLPYLEGRSTTALMAEAVRRTGALAG
jgi:rfaE bifunctional protein nucleotidyltransferase chain/domain/rfaE bifunctional protein kinase chain/domain